MNVLSSLNDFLALSISKSTNSDPKNNLLIFSDPRGGSTWLTQLIGTIEKTCVLWEPLGIAENNDFKKIGFL